MINQIIVISELIMIMIVMIKFFKFKMSAPDHLSH